MSLSELLKDFAGVVSGLATDAPDEYPDWSYRTYEGEIADVQQLWAEIRAKLKRDIDKVEWIEGRLTEGLSAFDAGEKEKGRRAMWDIYNSGVTRLR